MGSNHSRTLPDLDELQLMAFASSSFICRGITQAGTYRSPITPSTIPSCHNVTPLLGLGRWAPRVLWNTGLEAVLELAGNGLEVTHASGSSGLPSLGLLGPVVCSIVSLCTWNGIMALLKAMSNDSMYAHPLIFAAGYPHDEQVCFWTWRDRRPEFIELVPVLLNSFLNPAQSDALYPLSQDPESTDRSVCTERATCCGVFRKMRFPSL